LLLITIFALLSALAYINQSSTRRGTVLFLKFSGKDMINGSPFLSPQAISTFISRRGNSLNVLT
jgi:hypothetical protein